MGKKKIGELYNKPIVEGDINLKTPNEIHKDELGGAKEDDDTIITKGSEYVWSIPSPRGNPDEDKWQKYKNALELFINYGAVFDCGYLLSYSGQMIYFRGGGAISRVYNESILELPDGYIYNSISFIRDGSSEIYGVKFNSIVDFYSTVNQTSKEEVIEELKSQYGLQLLPLEQYKYILNMIKQ